MMTDFDRFMVFALTIVAIAFVSVIILAGLVVNTNNTGTVEVTIPVCQEDEPYLLGYGDWDGRRWDYYQCVHFEEVE
jgi:hypothetical protein